MPFDLSNLDAKLRQLEARIRERVPTCEFYLGGEDEETARQKSGPYVVWLIAGGEESEETREVSDTDRVHYLDDMVRITARVAGLVPGGEQGPDVRRQQLAASLQVFLAVSWAVNSLCQGYSDDRGWSPVGPRDMTASCYPIDYTFRLRAGRWTPAVDQVQPDSAPGTVTLEAP